MEEKSSLTALSSSLFLPPAHPPNPPSCAWIWCNYPGTRRGAFFMGLPSTVLPSRHHPRGASRSLVYARAVSRPLSAAFLAVMVVALAAVLQGTDILGTMLWAAPLTYALVSAWAVYQLRRRPAALVLEGSHGAVPSVWEVAGGGPLALRSVYAPRWEGAQLSLPIGRTVHALRSEDWPDFGAVERAATAAASASQAYRMNVPLAG